MPRGRLGSETGRFLPSLLPVIGRRYTDVAAAYSFPVADGRAGDIRRRQPSEFEVSYRHVSGLNDEWFIAATCRLTPGDKDKSLQLIKELLAHRAATQPTSEYNCGSVFRNPPNQHAAKLIESCGLKGQVFGGARVSEKHANFIINHEGMASANDIESLIQFVQKTVHEQTSIELIREVHIIGDESC